MRAVQFASVTLSGPAPPCLRVRIGNDIASRQATPTKICGTVARIINIVDTAHTVC